MECKCKAGNTYKVFKFIKIYPEWNVNIWNGIKSVATTVIKIYPEWNVNSFEM